MSADRVREVVREAVLLVLEDQSATVVRDGCVLRNGTAERRKALEFCADTSADRAAEQLAGVGIGLSAEESEILAGLRRSAEGQLASIGHLGCGIPENLGATVALLDRLLAWPPLTRVALIEAFVAGAEYVQDHWYVGEQLSIELDDGADIERAAEQHASLMKTAPDYRAAVTALLDSDMPAGELRKALEELVGDR